MIGHLEEFNKLLAKLANLEEMIKDEDKALILMNSLPESYEPFVTTWIYGKEILKYGEISSALMNHEVRHLDRQESNNSEALMVRGRSKEKKGSYKKNSRFRTKGVSKNRKFLDKDECAFYHEKGHWKNDCPKIKEKTRKKKDDSEANMVEVEDEEFVYALIASSTVDYMKEGFSTQVVLIT